MLRIGLIAVCGVLLVPSALGKGSGPSLVCGRHRCVSIKNPHLARILSDFYWSAERPRRAPRVPLGTPGFELRWSDGYATGMVAGTMLKRFRAYGFYCERFQRGKWYWIPPRAAAALRRMTAGMRPMRVSAPPPSC
jgi:hypothetical protein